MSVFKWLAGLSDHDQDFIPTLHLRTVGYDGGSLCLFCFCLMSSDAKSILGTIGEVSKRASLNGWLV